MVEQEPHQGAAQLHPGPGRSGEYSLVAGAVPGRQVAEGAEEVGDGAPPGRQNRGDQEGGESLVGRVGEGEDQRVEQRVRLGW